MPKHIVITGPESTGKTELCKVLADHFNCQWEPEYAREYVENLNNKYSYEDVEKIATHQISTINALKNSKEAIIFFDTSLMLTKVWFEVVYKKTPQWFLDAYIKHQPNFYLLCAPDIPWIADSVRENGGKMRNALFSAYQKEIATQNIPYGIVKGMGEHRTKNAIQIVEHFMESK